MRDAKKDEYVFLGLLLIPTIWFALLIAPYMDKGLINAIPYLNEALNPSISNSMDEFNIKNDRYLSDNLCIRCWDVFIFI